jgi:hypothetical protein
MAFRQDDIAGFEVAVNDSGAVCRVQTHHDLPDYRQRFIYA